MAEETPGDKPNIPNFPKPAVPPNGLQKDKGLAELNKKLEAVKEETKEVKESAEKNTDKIVKALDKNAEKTKPDKKTAEQVSEEVKDRKKFLDKLTGMFDGIKKGLTGGDEGYAFMKPLVAMWGFIKKFGKRMGLLFVAGGLLSMVKIEDIERVFTAMGKVFESMMKFLDPILKEIKIYMEERGLPTAFKFIQDTLKSVEDLFNNLAKNFKGWTESGWDGKVLKSLKSIEIIGDFVTDFATHVMNAFFNFIGFDGSITKKIKKYMEGVFGPTMTENILTFFNWVAGLMTITQLFGPKFLKPTTSMWEGGWWRSAYFLFKTNITRLLMWVAGLCATWPFALAAGITILTATYAEDISHALESALKKVTNWFTNLPALVNNALVDTWLGKAMGLEKKNIWDYDASDKQDAYNNQLEKREAAKVELARLQEWKRMSATPGPRGLADLQQAGFDGRLEDADLRIKIQKNEIKRLDDIAKNWYKNFKNDIDKTNLLIDGKTETTTKQDIKDIITSKINIPIPTDQSGSTPVSIKKTGIVSPLMPNIAPMKKPLSQPMDLIRAMQRAQISEAFMPISYKDRNTRSIGYGFNLGKPEAQSLLAQAGIKHTLQELWEGSKGITKPQAKRLQQLEAYYYKDQAMKFAGDLWGGMSAMQKEGLWDMSYQMGSLMDHTGLKAAMVAGDDEKILWEIMQNSLYGKQTPGRALENAEMLLAKNQSGQMLGAVSQGASNGTTTVVIDKSTHQSNESANMVASNGSANQQNNLVKDKA